MNRRHFLGAVGAGAVAANSLLGQNETAREDLFEGVKSLIKGKEPLIWVITGDSITHGALHTYGWRSYPEHFAERVRFELRRMNDFVINTGISGDTMKGISAKLDWRVFQFRPNVVSLKMGMNDCKDANGAAGFRQLLEAFVEKTLEHKAITLLNTPNLIDFVKSPERKALPDYVEVIRETAVKYKQPLVDHYAHWTKETANSSRLQFWLNDGAIHPNNFGHVVLAKKIFQDLGIFDPAAPTCRFFVP